MWEPEHPDPKPASALRFKSYETFVQRIKGSALLNQLREVEIDHEGKIYRLRLTQFNKLILTA